MKPTPMRTLGYDPTTTSPANVPSYADEREGYVVYLSHPLGREHPSLLEAVKRYRAKGGWWSVRVVDFAPAQAAA